MLPPASPLDRLLDRADRALANRTTFFGLVALAALLTYGYQIFSFQLGIDEELHLGFYSDVRPLWIAQARWGVAIVNYLFLPQPVTPVVSTALGVIGLCIGLYLGFSRLFAPLALFCAVLMGLTFPVLAFLVGFKTLSYAMAFAWIAAGLFPRLALHKSWPAGIGACLCGTFALGIYQTMILALAVLCAASLLALLLAGVSARDWWRAAGRLAGGLVVSCLVYLAIDLAVRSITGTPLYYVQDHFDLKGFLAHPSARFGAAFTQTHDTLGVAPWMYGSRAHVTSLTLAIAGVLLLARTLAMPRLWPKLMGSALIVGSGLTLILADAMPPDHAAIWSWASYLPFFLAAMVGFAASSRFRWIRAGIVAMTVLSVISSAAVTNRLQAASSISYQRDLRLAGDIETAIHAAAPDLQPGKPLTLVLVGDHTDAETRLVMHRTTFGASFFDWDMGNRFRVGAFMSLVTATPMTGALPDIYRAHAAEGDEMPTWPAPGSVRVHDGIAMVKLSEYTIAQKQELCGQGAREFCK